MFVILHNFTIKAWELCREAVPWWRGRTGDWASRGWALGAASGHTDEDRRSCVRLRLVAQRRAKRRRYSPRCPCPCWAAPAAGEEVRREDAWACPRVESRRRPAGTDREGSWTGLREKPSTWHDVSRAVLSDSVKLERLRKSSTFP